MDTEKLITGIVLIICTLILLFYRKRKTVEIETIAEKNYTTRSGEILKEYEMSLMHQSDPNLFDCPDCSNTLVTTIQEEGIHAHCTKCKAAFIIDSEFRIERLTDRNQNPSNRV